MISVEVAEESPGAGDDVRATATCPAGYVASGGGYAIEGPTGNERVLESRAVENDRWRVSATNVVVGATLVTSVQCLRLS